MALPVDVLLIRPWTFEIDSIVRWLRAADLEPTIERVDFEPALRAALKSGRYTIAIYSVAIYDPQTESLSREVVENALREHAPQLPLIVLDDAQRIGASVRAAVQARQS